MMKWSFKKFASNMVTLAGVVGMMWLVASYVDVLLNNEFYHREASNWNAIKIMVEGRKMNG